MKEIFVGIDGTTMDWYKNIFFSDFDLRYSYIKMLFDASVAPKEQKIHLAGPNLWGGGTTWCVRDALAFLKPFVQEKGALRIVLCGYSRGAYACLRVAQALELVGVPVDFLGLIDTVKCTTGDTEEAIARAVYEFAQGPGANDISAKKAKTWQDAYGETMANYEIQKNRNVALGKQVNKQDHFFVADNVRFCFNARRCRDVNSRTVPMGHWDVKSSKRIEEMYFMCTHSAMGGMPFRGDIPSAEVTRLREWVYCQKVGVFITTHAKAQRAIGNFTHPVIGKTRPPSDWYLSPEIQSQYTEYFRAYGSDGSNSPGDAELEAREKRIQAASASAGAMYSTRYR